MTRHCLCLCKGTRCTRGLQEQACPVQRASSPPVAQPSSTAQHRAICPTQMKWFPSLLVLNTPLPAHLPARLQLTVPLLRTAARVPQPAWDAGSSRACGSRGTCRVPVPWVRGAQRSPVPAGLAAPWDPWLLLACFSAAQVPQWCQEPPVPGLSIPVP